MYSAIQIANFFIEKHKENKKRYIDPVKLQELVYISYGWCWVLLRKELFSDVIQAWEFCPVSPVVWHAFKNQGSKIRTSYPIQIFIDEEIKEVLDAIYRVYVVKKSSKALTITHAPGTPWDFCYDGTRDKEIPKVEIRHYYESIHKARRKNLQK